MSLASLRILVVDDERPIRRFLRASLTAHGYDVSEATTGQEALSMAAAISPELIILDLGLPDMEGIDVTRQIRSWSQVPILILSVREDEREKVLALDAGADDYLTKPFGTDELLARIRVAIRRFSATAPDTLFQIGELTVDLMRHLVTRQEEEISLTPTEYDLLRLLVLNAGKVLTHHQILRQVWGEAYEEEMHLLRVNMSNLRKKIELDPTRPQYLLTEPGVGYRLKIDRT